jgi:hypothetical protein
MLKNMAILALVLAAQAPSRHSGGQTLRDGNDSHKPPAQAVAVGIPKTPPKDQLDARRVAPDNAEQHVKLTDVPPISIVKTPKDWLDHIFDWGPWVSNFLLVVVGAVGGGFAWQTLRAINRQAELMKDQLDSSRQKERPKLRIELEELDLRLIDSPDMISIECKIQNYGGSVAFISGNIYGCWIGETDRSGDQAHDAIPMMLPEVMIPGEKSYNPVIFLPDEDRIVDWTMWARDDPRIEKVRKGEASIYLSGFIHYQNIFDETWSLGFKRKFTVSEYTEDFSFGRWSREGDAENYERLELQPQKGFETSRRKS